MSNKTFDNTFSGAAFPYVFTDTDSVRVDYTATKAIRRGEMFLENDNPSDDNGLAVFTQIKGKDLEVVVTNRQNDILAAGRFAPYPNTKDGAPSWKGFLEVNGQDRRIAMSVWEKEHVNTITGETSKYHQLKRDRRQLPTAVPVSMIGGTTPAPTQAANA